MNQAIDFGQLVQLLGIGPQLVGDVIPFHRRGINPMNTTEGARPRYGGGGSVVPFGRPMRPTDQQMYSDALRQQKGEPQTQRGGPWRIGPKSEPPKHWDIHNVERLKAEKIKRYEQERAKEMVEQQWHANTPNMNKALQKLTPSEVNKLFDVLFKAPPGVEFP